MASLPPLIPSFKRKRAKEKLLPLPSSTAALPTSPLQCPSSREERRWRQKKKEEKPWLHQTPLPGSAFECPLSYERPSPLSLKEKRRKKWPLLSPIPYVRVRQISIGICWAVSWGGMNKMREDWTETETGKLHKRIQRPTSE
jgi:hypothetical protein